MSLSLRSFGLCLAVMGSLSMSMSMSTAIAAPSGPTELFICVPGSPAGGDKGQEVATQLSQVLQGSKTAKGQYFDSRAAAEAHLKQRKPGLAMISLPLYLRWRQAGRKLTPLAAVTRGGQAKQRYRLLVGKNSKLSGLAGLKGQTIHSNHAHNQRFVSRVLFAKLPKVEFKVPARILKSLKLCRRGKVAAVLVNEREWSSVQELRSLKGGLRVLAESEAVPSELLVALASLSEAEQSQVKSRLPSFGKDPVGQKLLKLFAISGFQSPKLKDLEAVWKRYQTPSKEPSKGPSKKS